MLAWSRLRSGLRSFPNQKLWCLELLTFNVFEQIQCSFFLTACEYRCSFCSWNIQVSPQEEKHRWTILIACRTSMIFSCSETIQVLAQPPSLLFVILCFFQYAHAFRNKTSASCAAGHMLHAFNMRLLLWSSWWEFVYFLHQTKYREMQPGREVNMFPKEYERRLVGAYSDAPICI